MATGSDAGSGLFEAVPNFSEGRDAGLVAELGAGPATLDVHRDADHHRCVITMAGDLDELSEAVLAKVRLAVARLDLRRHVGLHPRVGVADVVPFVPLGTAAMADAVAAAHRLGTRVWHELQVPVFFYGAAAGGRSLAHVRAGRCAVDLGGAPHPTAGAVCIGARPPLVAFNVSFAGMELASGRSLAGRMRELPGVQALSFPLAGGSIQLSMNLTRLELTAVPAAFGAAVRLAGRPGQPELVGLCPAAAAGPGCDGALLEARLAALAAGRAADRARARGNEEMSRLGARLAAEGRALRAIPITQEAILAGSERVAALGRVLRAGDLADPLLELMVRTSVRGLRAAIGANTAARFPGRVEMLDQDLAAEP